jgi:hypothetical protein
MPARRPQAVLVALAASCGCSGNVCRPAETGEPGSACLEGSDMDADGMVLVGYAPGQAHSPYTDLQAFQDQSYGLDASCFIVTARMVVGDSCDERPVWAYCPTVGSDRNIGNAVVHLSTFDRQTNVHRGDSPFAPAQLNLDLCSYQTRCMGLQTAEDIRSSDGDLVGECGDGPVFADLFAHHLVTATLLDGEGEAAQRVVGDELMVVADAGGASWHHDDSLGLDLLPLEERRLLTLTASPELTRVDISSELWLDTDCELWLGNSRRPFGALELTGPSYRQACFADAGGARVVAVPQTGADGLFFLAEDKADLTLPLAARLHEGSDAASDVAVCLHDVEQSLDGQGVGIDVTSYGYVEPVAHPGRVGLSHLQAPYDDWPTWSAGEYHWVHHATLVAGPPGADWAAMCSEGLTDCAW